ncbi:hypothetical protein UH38_12935 [Aliterella atlantica CENA595]|uniref:Uncharacterized protein n=1 Tax=Aliterella atlantica CENA595 TaxID=1618023 RepID=A0A0D8ZW46_9CYAN|nr:hypothetical protein UH38_12935 [Aliterella atlantica CENA595]
MSALLKTRQWLGKFHPIISLFIDFVINAVINLLILIILPAIRAAVHDFYDLILLIVKRKQ